MARKTKKSSGQVDASPVVTQRNKVKDSFEIRNFPWTEKQQEIIDTILDRDTKMVFIDGPAGSSKTLLSVYCGLRLLQVKKVKEFLYIRTVIESASKSLGYLPGELNSKIDPYSIPLLEKLEELLTKPIAKSLINKEIVKPTALNFLRGRSANSTYLAFDESQNGTFKELTTVITRLGKFSKLVITADTNQSDINGKSGFPKMFSLFDDEESKRNGIYCYELGKEDIMRSEILKYIIGKIDEA